MTIQELYTSGILEAFSTYARLRKTPEGTRQEAQVVLLAFLATISRKNVSSTTQLTSLLQRTLDEHQASPQVESCLTQFVHQYPPHQAGILLHQYLLALTKSDCSVSTIKNYRSDINQFFTFSEQTEIEKSITKTKVQAFARLEREHGRAHATIKRKLISLTQFALWLERMGAFQVGSFKWLESFTKNLPSSETDQVTPGSEPKTEKTRTLHTPHYRSAPKHTWHLPVRDTKDTHAPVMSTAGQAGKGQANQEYRNRLASGLAHLQSALSSQNKRSFVPYLNVALMVLVLIGLGFFGYRQFFTEPDSPLAYPSSLTRPNRTLSFQGRLTDTAQNPITSATDFRFKLYDSGPSTTGGTVLWDSTTCSVVPDQDGIFATGLGDDCGSEIGSEVFSENSNVWLEVEVEGETLDPRQSIKTVAYALNSETLQGYPASASAVENTVLVMNNSGEVVLGNSNPVLKATGNSFAIEAETLTLRTSSGSDGDIVLAPDGLGTVIAQSYLEAPGATLSATYAGGTSLVLRGGPSGTANIQEWQNSSGGVLSVVDESGNIGIGTTDASTRALYVNSGGANFNTTFQSTDDQVGLTIQDDDADFLMGITGTSFFIDRTNSFTAPDDFVLSNSGNIGIGTTNPSSFKLQVAGNVGPQSDSSYDLGSASLAWREVFADTFTQNGNVVCDASGNCGNTNLWANTQNVFHPRDEFAQVVDLVIGGNSTDSADFQVIGSGANAGYVYGRRFTDLDNTDYYIDPAAALYSGLFNGSVGIGVTNPGQKLEVNGNIKVGYNNFIGSNDSYNYLRMDDSASTLTNAANVAMMIDANNNTTTGYFAVGKDSPSLGTGTELFRIQENGSVGIGTTNPSTFLDSRGNVVIGDGFSGAGFNNDNLLQISSTTDGEQVGLELYSYEGTNNRRASFYLDDAAGLYGLNTGYSTGAIAFDIASAGTSRLRIDTAGNVGIGVTNPSSILHVAKSSADAVLQLQRTTSGSSLVQLSALSGSGALRTGGAYPLYFGVNGANNASINTSGNFGIGTTDAAKKLEIRGGTYGEAVQRFNNGIHTWDLEAGQSGYSSQAFSLYYDGAQQVRFMENSMSFRPATTYSITATSNLDIDPSGVLYLQSTSGNVAIGTTNSGAFRLRVAGSVGPDADSSYDLGSASLAWREVFADTFTQNGNEVCDTSGNCTSSGLWQNTDNVFHPRDEWAAIADLVIGGDSTSSADFRVTGVGNGTTNLAGYVYGKRFLDIDDTDYYIEPGNTTTAGYFAGNVGIGLGSAPGQKLHIGDGNILVEGGGETALLFKRDITYTGGASGTSANPIFQIGRITQAGDGDPELRFFYSDDATSERSVLEFDRKGIVSSVKPAVGSFFEGHISGDSQPYFRLNSYPNMRLEMGPGGSTDTDVAVERTDTNTLSLYTNSTQQVTINPDGNVGIGSTDPAYKLDVDGDINLSSTQDIRFGGLGALGGDGGATYLNSTGTTGIYFRSNAAANLGILTNAGNLGIGTTDPQAVLEVSSGYPRLSLISEVGVNAGIDFKNSSGTLKGNVGYNFPNDWMTFSTNNIERMKITSAGNLGLGTTNPSSFKLQVAGNVGPNADSSYDLGSASLAWREVFADAFTQNGNEVCDASGNCTSSGLWQNTDNVFHPRDEWAQVADLVIGGDSTSSADFRVTGVGNGTTNLNGYVYGRRFIDIDSTSYYVEPGNTTTSGLFASNVGVGTTNTNGARLNVYGSGTSILKVEGGSTGSPARRSIIELASGDSNRARGILTSSGGTEEWFMGAPYGGSGFTIGYGASQAEYVAQSDFRILTNGNVGIGSTNPSKLLDVNGDAIISGSGRSLQISSSSTAFLNFSNTNNSISYASNQFAFNTTQSQGFTFNGGNVGIGTTSASEELHIIGSGTDIPVRIEATGAGGTPGIEFEDPTATNYGGRLYFDDTNNGMALVGLQNGTEHLGVFVERDNGNVGIGTTSADSQLHLYNDGSSDLEFAIDNGTATALFEIPTNNVARMGTETNHSFELISNNTSRLKIFNNGNIGISTTSASDFGVQIGSHVGPSDDKTYDLGSDTLQWREVFAETFTQNGNPVCDTSGNCTSNGLWANSLNVFHPKNEWASVVDLAVGGTSTASADILLQSDGDAYFGGSVGIGVTNPSAKLEVAGGNSTANIRVSSNVDAYVDIRADEDNNSAHDSVVRYYEGTSGRYSMGYDASANIFSIDSGSALDNSNFLTINSGGNVGLGTTAPDSKLTVYGANQVLNIQNTGGSAGDGGVLRFGHNQSSSTLPLAELRGELTNGGGAGSRAGDLSFWTSDAGTLAERMRITDDGNVGIGITNPNTKLYVAGDATFRNSADSSNSVTIDSGSTAAQNSSLVFADRGTNYFSWQKPSGNTFQLWDHQNSTSRLFIQAGANSSNQYRAVGTGDHSFLSGSTEIVTFTDGGNVGIGTTDPDERLHVRGNVSIGNNNFAVNAPTESLAVSGGLIQGGNPTSNFGAVQFTQQAGSDAGYSAWIMNNAYWDGANWRQPRGTTTSSYMFAASHHLGWSWQYAGPNGTNDATISPTEVANMNSAGTLNLAGNIEVEGSGDSYVQGNLGIGITDPSQKLEVSGSAVISGTLSLGGYLLKQENAASVTAGNWYRIAENSGNRADASFTLRDTIGGGGHSTLRFNAGTNYNNRNGNGVTVQSHTYYSSPTFTQVRIVTNTTYDEQYLEVYVTKTGSVSYTIWDNQQASGWEPLDWDAGSVPSGYTAQNYDVQSSFVAAQNGDAESIRLDFTGNVGIGVTDPSYKLDIDGDARIASGSDLYIGSIGLNDVGTSRTTSGASLVGTYDEFTYSNGLNVQDVLDDLDSQIASIVSGSAGAWTDAGTYLYPTNGEVLGNSASAGSNKIAGLYLADSSPLTFGTDNDVTFNFSGTTLAVTQGNQDVNFDSNTLFIDGSANSVGIGTNSISSGHKLDVNGNIYASGGGVYTSNNFVFGNSTSGGEYFSRTGNDISVVAGGSNRFYVDGDGGNVGIGTTDPQGEFEIVGNNPTSLQLTYSTYPSYYTQFIQGYSDNGFRLNVGGTNIIKTYGYNDADAVSFGVLGYEDALHIDTNGSVGIGITSPGQKLQVAGNILLDDNADSSTNLIIDSGSSAANTSGVLFRDRGSNYWQIQKNANNDFILYDSNNSRTALKVTNSSNDINFDLNDTGNFSIGTTSTTAARFYVEDTVASTNPHFYLKATSASGTSNDGPTLKVETGRGDSWTSGNIFEVSNSAGTKLAVRGDGAVGIGTSNPLAVIGTATYFAGVTPKTEIITGTSTDSYEEFVSIRHNGKDADAELRRLGLLIKLNNESSDGESDKSGGIILESSQAHANTPDMHLLVADAKRLTILNGGSVGIGITNPSYKLDIDGDARIASGSDLYIGSIGLNDVGTSRTTSGASLVGTYDEFAYSNSSTVQDVLDDLDAQIASVIGGGVGVWTDVGNHLYPTNDEYIGNEASGTSSQKITGLYLADSAPLVFGNDNDVSFNFSGSVLGVTTGNNDINFDSNTLYIDGSANRVGINTTTPTAPLDIAITSGTALEFDNGGARITLHDGYGNFNIKTGVDNNNLIDDGTTGGTHFRMDSNGYAHLWVDESTTVGGSFSADAGLTINGGVVDIDYGDFAVNGTTVITSSLVGQNFTQMNVDNLRLDGNTLSATDNGGVNIYDNASNGITVLDGGNVGISSTNPNNALDVYTNASSVYAAHIFNDQNSAGHGLLVQTDGSAVGTYALKVTTATETDALTVDGTGDLWLGANSLSTASFGFDVSAYELLSNSNLTIRPDGNLNLQADNDSDDYVYLSTESNVPVIRTAGTSNLAIIPDGGNVGIGSTSPAAVLDVVGDLDLTDRTRTYDGTVNTFENVASYYNGNSINTGTIVVKIGDTENKMIDAEIVVQGYDGVSKYHVRGYTYTGSTTWHQPQATCLTSGRDTCEVRFGKETATDDRVILLGTTSTSWGSYPHVLVTRVTNGYGNTTEEDWSISIETSEAAYSNIASVNENDGFVAYDASFTGTTYFAGTSAFNSSGSLGIGDTTPDAPLDVVGDVYISDGLSLYETAVSNGTVEATKFCTGDGESNCVTDFSALASGASIWTDAGSYIYPTNGEAVQITSTGGATNPLYIAASTGSSAAYFREDSSNDIRLQMDDASGTSRIWLDTRTSAGSYFNAGNFSIGTSSYSSNKLRVESNENAESFYFYQANGTTGERDVFTIEDADSGGGGQDESSSFKVLRSGAFSASDDGSSLVELTYTGGTADADEQFYMLGRTTDEGAVNWGISITDSDFWTTGSIRGGATGTNCSATDAACFNSPSFQLADSGDSYINGGNLGIGIASPNAPLEIDTAQAGIFNIQRSGTSHDNTYQFRISQDGTGGAARSLYLQSVENTGDILLRGASSGNMQFVLKGSTGRVGIGATNPSENLHIQNANDAGLLLEADSGNTTETANAYLKLSQDGGVVQSILGTLGGNNVDPQGNSYTDSLSNATLLGTLDGNGALQFGTNDAVRMTIATTGFVGVGVTAPAQKLTIGGTSVSGTGTQTNISAYVNNGLRINGTGTSSQDAITYQSGSNGGGAAIAFGRGGSYDTFMNFYTNSSGGSSGGINNLAMSINSNGNVGVGGVTNASSELEVDGIINFTNTAGNLISHTAQASYDKIRVWNSSSYTIGMNSSQSYGYLSDYAMTFTMNNQSNRGFLWRDTSDSSSDGAMSLTTDGRLTVKSTSNFQGSVGIGNISSPSTYLDVNGNGTGTNSLQLRSGNGAFAFDSNQILLAYNGTALYRHAIKSRANGSADAGNSIDFYVWDQGTDTTSTIGTKHVMSLNGGNVGIGTTDPDAIFKVDNGSSNLRLKVNTDALSLGDAGSANKLPYIEWRESDGGTRAMYQGWGSTTGTKYINMQLENSYQLAITGGPVNIGASTQTHSGYDFEVSGRASWLHANLDGTSAISLGLGSNQEGTVPLYYFETNDTTGDDLMIRSYRWGGYTHFTRSSNDGLQTMAVIGGTDGGHNIDLYDNTTETVNARISSDGDSYITNNLGIGKTNPTAKLDVNGTSYFRNDAGILGGYALYVYDGTDPSDYLSIGSAAIIHREDGGNRNMLSYDYGGNYFYMYNWTQTRDYLRSYDTGNLALQPSGGNLAVGSTTASQTLDVNGAIQFNISTSGDTTIGVCKNTGDGTSAGTEFRECNGTPSDIAEYYRATQELAPGTVVALDTIDGVPKVYPATAGDKTKVFGVVSTYPVGQFGKPLGHSLYPDSENPAAIGLAGRVPVIVSTAQGSIKAGDPLMASNLPGVAVKATTQAKVIGFAMESFNQNSPKVSSEVRVQEDQRANSPMIFTAAPQDPTAIDQGKIMMIIQPQMYIPDAFFNAGGDLVINGSNGSYTATPVGGSALSTVLGAAEVITGKLRAGIVQTKELVVQNSAQIASLSVNQMNIAGQTLDAYVKNIVWREMNTAGSAQVASGSAQFVATGSAQLDDLIVETATVSGRLAAVDFSAQKTQLGSLLAENATISGTLVAENLEVAGSTRLSMLEAQQAELDIVRANTAELLDATVSGTLYANNINGLEDQIAQTLQKPNFLDVLLRNDEPEPVNDNPIDIYTVVESAGYEINPDLMASAGATLAFTDGDVMLNGQAAYVQKYLQVNGLAYVADSLGVGNSLFVGNSTQISDGVIAYTPTAENDTLRIQPSGQGKLEFLAGLMTLEDGQVTVTGNFYVAGTTQTDTLLTNLVQPADFGNPFQVQVAGVSSSSGQLEKSRFEIINELGTPVATISAEGKAAFAGGIGVGSESIDSPDVASGSAATVTASKTSGKAVLKAGSPELIIENEQITAESLIYVTPVGSTQNQVLYVKSQTAEDTGTSEKEGQFTVGFDQAIGSDVSFNWWIVN